MKFSSLLRLYRVRVRARLTQELFAVLGIAIGVSLLFASQVANTSLDGSVQRLTNGIVGHMRFQLASRDSHGFDERLLGEVARIPGVQAVAPVLEQNANIVGPAGAQSVDLVGTDPRLARLGGRIAKKVNSIALGRASVVTLPPSIAHKIGALQLRRVEIQLGASTVGALFLPQASSAVKALGESPIALAPIATVQRLSGLQGRVTSIYVRSPKRLDASVHARLEQLAGGRLNVRPADITTQLFRRAAGPVDQSTSLFSALSALVGFLFAFNALLLTVPQRRNLIQDLRLDGYTRRMIVEVLLLDALVLGVLASALGLLLGQLLSVALFSSNPGYLSFAFPIGPQRIVSWWSFVLAAGGGMVAAVTGVLAPLRGEISERLEGSARMSARPVHARSQRLVLSAALCLAGTTIILLAAPQAAIAGVVILTIAMLLFLPPLLGLAVRVSTRLQRLFSGVASYLALIELRSGSNRARSLAIAATGAIAVFGSVSIQGARDSLQRGLEASARATDSRADIWITPAGTSNSLSTTSFPDVAEGTLARLPGVRAVQLYRGSFLDWGDRRIWTLAQPRADMHPLAASQLVEGNLALTNARLRANGWIVISRAVASEHGLRIGDSFTLPTTHAMSFRVAALSTNLGWPPGAVILNADDYARAWASEDPSAYQLRLTAGASAITVSRESQRALGPRSGLHVETTHEREQRQYSTASQALSRLSQIRNLVLIAAVLATAAAMGAMIWQRRARLADMKVDGFSRVVLWRSLLWESAILVATGCALGAVLGLYGQLVLTRALSAVTGFPVIESPPLSAALGSFALITAVAVAIVAIPGYAAARVHPTIGLPD